MPSWNMHTAHVERLLAEEDPARLGVRDPNCFLFGNYVPDVYVGYMVPEPSHVIDYRVTHEAESDPIPVPRHRAFWDRFLARGHASDVTLGAWCHLVCDATYNQATRDLLAERGLGVTRETRVMKQGDFATFGRTLPISRRVEATDELLRQCAEFPHYPILAADVRAACAVACGIVEDNERRHIDGVPEYRLLDEAWFLDTFERVNALLLEGLRAYASAAR